MEIDLSDKNGMQDQTDNFKITAVLLGYYGGGISKEITY